MSDLISRSKAISVLKQLEEHSLSGKMDISNAIYLLENQPTAYSVDKVIEELELIRAKKTCNKEKCDTKELCRICVVDDAIEIVKHGGASDDVCEYENTDDEYCKWKINSVFHETINNPHVAERENIATTKYCPCCGKKIKVVE